MKTPREILFERHRAAAPKLDSIRHEIINYKFHRNNFAAKVWQELVFPCRQVWTGLAAVWILVFIANFSICDHSQTVVAKSAPTPEMILAFRQQERLLNELIGQSEMQPAEPLKVFLPRPSSRLHSKLLTT